jgi:hypothetical protein
MMTEADMPTKKIPKKKVNPTKGCQIKQEKDK